MEMQKMGGAAKRGAGLDDARPDRAQKDLVSKPRLPLTAVFFDVERRIRLGLRKSHTKTLTGVPIPKVSLAQPCRIGQWGPSWRFSARAGVQLRHTRRVMGRVDCGAIDDHEMYITVVSSATWNSHTRAYMHFHTDF